jgi:3'-phosphoadenosine 5'-phosphosulfate (PAPS) 3'-phosphatase
MTLTKEASKEINLIELLSTLADACSRGCQVIRTVNQKRQQQKKDPNQKALNVQYKVADDPRSALTEADLNSQLVIMDCIRSVYGFSLNVIGEEDGDEDEDEGDEAVNGNEKDVDVQSIFNKYNVDPISKRGINKTIFDNTCSLGADADFDFSKASVSLEDVTVYIDPMDGTREFVEERLQNVQCLIGITHKGQPVGGVIGLPFVSFETSEDSHGDDNESINVVCAMNMNDCNVNMIDTVRFQNGVCQNDDGYSLSWQSLEKDKEPASAGNDMNTSLKIFTGDSSRIHKKHALEYLEKFTQEKGDSLNLCITGGCGNKILRTTAYGTGNNGNGNAIAVITPGTCSWDTAAPTSILFASMAKFGIKGKVTDLFGGELVYTSSGKIVENDLGAFISCGEKAVEYHDKLTMAMRGDAIILDSSLRKYWNNFGGDDSTCSTSLDKDEEETRLKLKNAQSKTQRVHEFRNAEGRVIKCEELQSMVSDQKDVEGSKLIGYATSMPSESNGLQLFWRRGKDSSLPDVVQINRTTSSLEITLS